MQRLTQITKHQRRQQRSLLTVDNSKTHYLFGYGSLIHSKSRSRTIGKTTSAIPVFVSTLSRSWSYNCRDSYTAVGVYRKQSSDHSIFQSKELPTTKIASSFSSFKNGCNGVLFPLPDPENDLMNLDLREAQYTRRALDLSEITIRLDHLPRNHLIKNHLFHSFQDLFHGNCVIWVYELPLSSISESIASDSTHNTKSTSKRAFSRATVSKYSESLHLHHHQQHSSQQVPELSHQIHRYQKDQFTRRNSLIHSHFFKPQKQSFYSKRGSNFSTVASSSMELVKPDYTKESLFHSRRQSFNEVHFPFNSAFVDSETSSMISKTLHTPCLDTPIPQSYLDCILDGCLEYGVDFAKEFLDTTFGWNAGPWLNDRDFSKTEIKYIADTKYNYSLIDQLLWNQLPYAMSLRI